MQPLDASKLKACMASLPQKLHCCWTASAWQCRPNVLQALQGYCGQDLQALLPLSDHNCVLCAGTAGGVNHNSCVLCAVFWRLDVMCLPAWCAGVAGAVEWAGGGGRGGPAPPLDARLLPGQPVPGDPGEPGRPLPPAGKPPLSHPACPLSACFKPASFCLSSHLMLLYAIKQGCLWS